MALRILPQHGGKPIYQHYSPLQSAQPLELVPLSSSAFSKQVMPCLHFKNSSVLPPFIESVQTAPMAHKAASSLGPAASHPAYRHSNFGKQWLLPAVTCNHMSWLWEPPHAPHSQQVNLLSLSNCHTTIKEKTLYFVLLLHSLLYISMLILMTIYWNCSFEYPASP